MNMLATIQAGALTGRRTSIDHKPCPFCLQVPEGLALRIAGRSIVGCDSDECHEAGRTAQASADTAEEAWAAWDFRAEARAK